MVPLPPLYPPPRLLSSASADEVASHEVAMKQYARMMREQERSVMMETLVVLGMLIATAVAFGAATVFGEHIFLFYIGALAALLFGGLCFMAASIAKDLWHMRER